MANPPYVATPPAYVQSQMEVNVYCDVAAALAGGSLGSIVSATLTNQSSGADLTATNCVGSPTINGTKLVQVVKALPRGSYWLTFIYTLGLPDFVGEQIVAMQPIETSY